MDGLTFVAMRVLLPSEQSFSFNSLFHVAAPKLFDMENCRRVQLIISDGDSQEMFQIDLSICASIFPSAQRQRCSWHMVDRTWNTGKKPPMRGVKMSL